MIFCENCGSKLEDGAKFCDECGYQIKIKEEILNIPDQNLTEDINVMSFKRSKRTKFIIIAVVIMLICSAAVIAVLLKNPQYEGIKSAITNKTDTYLNTEAVTTQPTRNPTIQPTEMPTPEPTKMPTPEPTKMPTPEPTKMPTPESTVEPTIQPTDIPTIQPSVGPTIHPQGTTSSNNESVDWGGSYSNGSDEDLNWIEISNVTDTEFTFSIYVVNGFYTGELENAVVVIEEGKNTAIFDDGEGFIMYFTWDNYEMVLTEDPNNGVNPYCGMNVSFEGTYWKDELGIN